MSDELDITGGITRMESASAPATEIKTLKQLWPRRQKSRVQFSNSLIGHGGGHSGRDGSATTRYTGTTCTGYSLPRAIGTTQ